MENDSFNEKVSAACTLALSAFFVLALSMIMCAIFAKFAYLQIGKRVGLVVLNQAAIYNAEKDYPFEDRGDSVPFESAGAIANGAKVSRFARVKNLILTAEQKITMYCTDNLPKRIVFVLPKKRLDKALGLNMTSSMGVVNPQTSSDVVTRFDGEWLGMPLCTGSMEYSAANLKSVIAFARQMESEGRNFLVFENPDKFCDCIGYENYYEKNNEMVNATLRENGIRVVDLNDYMAAQGLRHRDIFLKTDHHWQPRAGLWGNAILCDELNKQFSFNIDTGIFDLSNYDIKVYPNQFLGSLGKKVTEVYVAKEDFDLITPAYPTDITMFSSAVGKERTGTIPEVFYYMDVFKVKNVYARNEYALYTNNQDCALIVSHNNKLHDGSNMLFIHFSFGDVQIPTLTQAVEDFYAIDLRHFTGSLQTFIKEKNPSTVVLAYPTQSYIGKWERPTPTESRDKFDFR